MQGGLFGPAEAIERGRAKRRITEEPTYNRVLQCRACDLSQKRWPVPYRGPYPSRVAIVGEAPGQQEDARGGPFVGPAGVLLQEQLRINRVIPDRLFWMNVVSCFPQGRDGLAPKQYQIDACSGNVWAQLSLCQPEWVVLVGGVALKAMAPWPLWKGHIKTITNMRGVCWAYKSMYWTAILHPAAALRQKKFRSLFEQDVSRLVGYLRGGPWWSEECWMCGSEVYRYDETGMAWCRSCQP